MPRLLFLLSPFLFKRQTRHVTPISRLASVGLLLLVVQPIAMAKEPIWQSTLVQVPDGMKVVGSQKLAMTENGVQLRGGSLVSKSPPASLFDALSKSNELTLEVWLTPLDKRQAGPARIVTLSRDTSNRCFTLGQEQDRLDFRLRTSQTDNNGLPSLSSSVPIKPNKLSHVVVTRHRKGELTMFLDGKQIGKSKREGSFRNWDPKHRLALGDEVSEGRAWQGKLHWTALFDVALSRSDIVQRYEAGLGEAVDPKLRANQLAAEHFELKVAPLLSRRCLECHDKASAKGELVLDRKGNLMSSDDAMIVPGKADESALWLSVVDDSMPHDRTPLTDDQKRDLKQWIDTGAIWTLDRIDPADYLHGARPESQHVRRLTTNEYIRAVQVSTGIDIHEQATLRLPRDLRADGFRNTAYNLTVDLKHVEAYHELAKDIVEQMDMRKFAKKFWGKARLTDNDMRGLIEKMGVAVLRGPLNKQEVTFFRGISTSVAADGGDYEQAVAATLVAMLQSPRFLYRIESQDDDGSVRHVDNYELASRISFAVWGSPPDQELMKFASGGQLHDSKFVKQHVARMMADPRARQRSHDFVSQWLNLSHLSSLQPDRKRFPNWNPELAANMQAETIALFDEVVWNQKRPIADLLNAQVTFCTPKLAKHYNLRAAAGERGANGLSRYDLSDDSTRGGLLTQGSVLTIGGDDASMVTRGLFVLNQLLRGVVNDPPPCVDTSPIPTSGGSSARSIAMTRIKNESCGGCHKRFEPLAFGLEKFDGLG